MDIKIGTDIELIKAADELRQAVFANEQGVPKEEIFDGLNFQSVHIVCFDGTLPVATARALKDGNAWRKQVRGFYEKLKFVQDGEVTKFESGFVLVPMKYKSSKDFVV